MTALPMPPPPEPVEAAAKPPKSNAVWWVLGGLAVLVGGYFLVKGGGVAAAFANPTRRSRAQQRQARVLRSVLREGGQLSKEEAITALTPRARQVLRELRAGAVLLKDWRESSYQLTRGGPDYVWVRASVVEQLDALWPYGIYLERGESSLRLKEGEPPKENPVPKKTLEELEEEAKNRIWEEGEGVEFEGAEPSEQDWQMVYETMGRLVESDEMTEEERAILREALRVRENPRLPAWYRRIRDFTGLTVTAKEFRGHWAIYKQYEAPYSQAILVASYPTLSELEKHLREHPLPKLPPNAWYSVRPYVVEY